MEAFSVYNEELWFTNAALEKSVGVDASDFQTGSVTYYVERRQAFWVRCW